MAGRDPPDMPSGPAPGKGKGKETSTTPDAVLPPPPDNTTSMLSRIAQSAAGLGRDLAAAGRPGSGGVGDLGPLAALGASGSSADKAAASASARRGPSSSGAETAAAAAAPSRQAGPSSASMRTTPADAHAHAAAQEAAFAQFLDGAALDPLPSLPALPVEPVPAVRPGRGPGPDMGGGLEAAWGTSPSPPETPASSSAVAAQERRDGLEVVQLLAAGGPAEEEPDYERDLEPTEDELAGLRRALFGSGSGSSSSHAGPEPPSAQAWDHTLNFLPDFVRPNPQGSYDDDDDSSLDTAKSRDSRAVLGIPHAPETTRLWLDQWHDVLTRYDDEVWGGLAPLVARAREEVDRLQAPPAEQPPAPASATALARLRQILGHLRDEAAAAAAAAS